MSRLDIQIKDVAGQNTIPTRVYLTEAGEADINMGEPVKLKAAASEYVIPLADGEPVIGTTTAFVGIAAGDSDHTASADGELEVYYPLDGLIYRASAKTVADIDTQAELDGVKNHRVVFDLTAGAYTIDTEAADGATNGLVIVDGDISAGTVDFMIRSSATLLD